ncbi:MAG: glycosyltransferase [Candidatus Eremiobacteraeota bacterium]|nr:glycosyltransferase [Candidatus Eremiobacteraeota bacterium]
MSDNGTTVGLPIYNEEANVGALIDFLLTEPGIVRIVAVDDHSSDASYAIIRERARRDDRVLALQTPERSGQLAAWRIVAERAATDSVVIVDADSRPAAGAVACLAEALAADAGAAIVSGRVEPDAASAIWTAARFRATILHRVRALQRPKEAIIGRFFAVRRGWFTETATRSDIIANDAFLGASAEREHLRATYVPEAVVRYCEAQTTYDFAAQRQRADAGYRQLRGLGILRKSDEPTIVDYARCLVAAAWRDPRGATAWIGEQIKARRIRAYKQSGKDEGAWEIQATTKRSID